MAPARVTPFPPEQRRSAYCSADIPSTTRSKSADFLSRSYTASAQTIDRSWMTLSRTQPPTTRTIQFGTLERTRNKRASSSVSEMLQFISQECGLRGQVDGHCEESSQIAAVRISHQGGDTYRLSVETITPNFQACAQHRHFAR